MDAATQGVIDKGVRNVEILKQPQYSPYPVGQQVAILYLGTKNLVRDVPPTKIKEFEEVFLMEMGKKHADILERFRMGKYEKADLAAVEALAGTITKQYK